MPSTRWRSRCSSSPSRAGSSLLRRTFGGRRHGWRRSGRCCRNYRRNNLRHHARRREWSRHRRCHADTTAGAATAPAAQRATTPAAPTQDTTPGPSTTEDSSDEEAIAWDENTDTGELVDFHMCVEGGFIDASAAAGTGENGLARTTPAPLPRRNRPFYKC